MNFNSGAMRFWETYGVNGDYINKNPNSKTPWSKLLNCIENPQDNVNFIKNHIHEFRNDELEMMIENCEFKKMQKIGCVTIIKKNFNVIPRHYICLCECRKTVILTDQDLLFGEHKKCTHK